MDNIHELPLKTLHAAAGLSQPIAGHKAGVTFGENLNGLQEHHKIRFRAFCYGLVVCLSDNLLKNLVEIGWSELQSRNNGQQKINTQ